jgi:non-ribosomal peptide synthetase component E (peptide arylation enzyme)
MASSSLAGLIDSVAERHEDRYAIVEGGTHLTFADLARKRWR